MFNHLNAFDTIYELPCAKVLVNYYLALSKVKIPEGSNVFKKSNVVIKNKIATKVMFSKKRLIGVLMALIKPL